MATVFMTDTVDFDSRHISGKAADARAQSMQTHFRESGSRDIGCDKGLDEAMSGSTGFNPACAMIKGHDESRVAHIAAGIEALRGGSPADRVWPCGVEAAVSAAAILR